MKSYAILLIAAFVAGVCAPGSLAEVVALGNRNHSEGTTSGLNSRDVPSPPQTHAVTRPVPARDIPGRERDSSGRWPFAINIQPCTAGD